MPDTRSKSSGGFSIIQAFLVSIGATGVLVGIGYIVAYSREHLLGIDITRAKATIDYGAIGARFFADVAVMLYRQAASQIGTLAIVLSLMIVLLLAARRTVILPPLRYRSLYVLVMLILLIAKLAYYDIPFVFHSDILLSRVDYSAEHDKPLDRHADRSGSCSYAATTIRPLSVTLPRPSGGSSFSSFRMSSSLLC